MQTITWTKEEFTASVAKKLAALRQVRVSGAASLRERLALAEDRIAFDNAGCEADRRRAALGQTVIPKPLTTSVGLAFFSRVEDEPAKTSPSRSREQSDRFDDAGLTSQDRRSGFTAADDSYGVGFRLSPVAASDKPVKPRPSSAASAPDVDPKATPSAGTPNVPADLSLRTEVPGDKISQPVIFDELAPPAAQERVRDRKREQVERLSSESWTVLDRASVLSKLQDHSEGLTMVQLAAYMLGATYSPRDTRRLSAMMAREEVRKTVTRSGRGQPLHITDAGKRALAKLDVAAEHARIVEIRTKRVHAQLDRIAGGVKAGATVNTGEVVPNPPLEAPGDALPPPADGEKQQGTGDA